MTDSRLSGFVVGIDPGKAGAIAILEPGGDLVSVHDMPVVNKAVNASLLTDLLDDELTEATWPTVLVEQVHSMPKQGVASSFDFGKSYGIVLGVVAGLRLPIEHVSPVRWKRGIRLTADKEMARQAAISTWPERSDWFKLKKHADRAEAALMALWFLRERRQALAS